MSPEPFQAFIILILSGSICYCGACVYVLIKAPGNQSVGALKEFPNIPQGLDPFDFVGTWGDEKTVGPMAYEMPWGLQIGNFWFQTFVKEMIV